MPKTIERIARLIQGKCSIHDVDMVRGYADSGLSAIILCCPRFNCGVTVNQFSGGTFELSPEFGWLLPKE